MTATRWQKLNPLRPEVTRAVVSAATVLAFSELVRNGIWMGYLNQVIQEQYHLPLTASTTAWALHVGTDTLLRSPMGALLNRYGPRLLMLVGALLCTVAVGLLPLAHSLWFLYLIAVLHGVGFSAMWPTTVNLTADGARQNYHGRALSLVGTAVMPAAGLGFFLFSALTKREGGEYLLWLASGLQLLAVLVAISLPRRRPERINADQTSASEPGIKALGQLGSTLLLLIPAAFIQIITLSSLGALIFVIAPDLYLSRWEVVALVVLGSLVGYGVMPFAGRFADHGQAREGVTLGYTLVGLSLTGFVFIPPLWVMLLLAITAGLGYAFLTPGWGALLTHNLPEAQRPVAWGLIMSVENIGIAIGPTIGALAIAHYGPTGPFLIGATLAVCTALGYILLGKRLKDGGERMADG